MCRENLPVVVRWAGLHMRQQFPAYSTCISGGVGFPGLVAVVTPEWPLAF